MSRLKKVAVELAGMGRHDLAREVALASLESKGLTGQTLRTAALGASDTLSSVIDDFLARTYPEFLDLTLKALMSGSEWDNATVKKYRPMSGTEYSADINDDAMGDFHLQLSFQTDEQTVTVYFLSDDESICERTYPFATARPAGIASVCLARLNTFMKNKGL